MKLIQTSTFRKWSDGLKDKKAQALISIRLGRIKQGHFGDVKNIGGGVLEMRLHYGPGYRIYYTRRGNDIIFLLAGGAKRTQRRDIRRAKEMVENL